MLKNDWVCLGLVCSLVACSDGDSASSADGTGAPGLGGASFGSGGSAGGPPGTGGALTGGGGIIGVTGGAGAVGAGGIIAMTGGAGAVGAGGIIGMTGGSAGASAGGSAGAGAGGDSVGGAAGGGTGGAGGAPPVVCTSSAPDEFEPNTTVGGGGAQYEDSPHFRVYGNASASAVASALKHEEAAYSCFVEDWCFRSTGLSVNSDTGPYYKMNIYVVGALGGGAGGVTRWDAAAGLSYLQILSSQVALPQVVVHEFGHALALTEYKWVDQTRTGAWWETMANWVADTYLTSSYCEEARNRFAVPQGNTIIDLNKVIGQSYLLIVSDQNYYQAWPFLAYLTNNPDGYPGLGRMAVPDLMRNHARNNETPLHVLERIASPVSVQTILGRYWARMAYLDIGHPRAQEAFFSRRGSLNFANVDSIGNQTYQVKSTRRPQYGGASIIPLSGTGEVVVQVTNLGNGLSESNFTATLAIRSSDGAVRYVDLQNGSGQATVGSNEEASLAVVNTPNTLYQYDAFRTVPTNPEAIGLNYQARITGAVPTN